MLGATYIVSSGDGALTTNNEGALWWLMWMDNPAGIMHDFRESVAAVSGLCKVECALRARTGAHPLAVGHPLPFVPFKFLVANHHANHSHTAERLFLVCNMPNAHAP